MPLKSCFFRPKIPRVLLEKNRRSIMTFLSAAFPHEMRPSEQKSKKLVEPPQKLSAAPIYSFSFRRTHPAPSSARPSSACHRLCATIDTAARVLAYLIQQLQQQNHLYHYHLASLTTAGFHIDCTRALLQYSACRGSNFVPRPGLKSLGQVVTRSFNVF